MDKLKMAHEVAVMMIANGCSLHTTIADAWRYADAMQAEADKREDKSIPDIFKNDKDGNCLHTHTTFGGGECFDCGVNLKKEWQPDWSQAPEWANWWAMDLDLNKPYWYEIEPSIDCITWGRETRTCKQAPSFNYTGAWQDSLHKRPQEDNQ